MPRRRRDKQRHSVRRSLAWLVVSVFLTFNGAALSAGDDIYQQAVDAFKRGAYQDALDGFLEAQSEGMDSAPLHYNLGAAYYKLERYDDAGEAFRAAARSPEFIDLAHYNLGLVAMRQGDDDEARQWLRLVLATAESANLRRLASSALSRVGEPLVAEDDLRWSGFVAGNIGYDSNVLLLSDTETLFTDAPEQDDFFFDIYGYALRPLRDVAAGPRLSIDASAYVLEHLDVDGFDIGVLRFGGTLTETTRRWRHDGAAHLDYAFLDGDEFTREFLLDWKATRPLNGRRRLRLGYEAARIDATDDSFAYLDGWRHSLDARLSWRPEPHRYYLLYDLEINDRQDRLAPLFTSYSPVRQTLRVVAQRWLRDHIEARAELRYRHSRYRDANELAGGGSERRVDERLRFIARLARLAANGTEISLEYRFTDNESNIPAYEYTRYRIMLGAFLPF